MPEPTNNADNLAVMILAHAEAMEERGQTATPANLRWIAGQVAQLAEPAADERATPRGRKR
ncbi:hypothetical protein QN355_06405 [Cryobacterium sp. 10S3]|uniref:hypothetical protein n=1 Tax=Cryobacterium sp. 10S3 TaxID=3048582 RepID=UPI002AC9B7E0|nr:hypothetical protein [Cryobacterium sp. 10S3]MEB0286180.1 hypothetical protein [Cryobacterium sp. 10S3]WPX12238.1 hypothetical protein RHM57_11145 [Cryobacterium sp. 10S3]